MITVGYGDILPINNTEMLVCLLMMFFSCGFFAYAINNIGMIVQEMFRAENDINRNLFIINNYMHNKKINQELRI